MFRTGPGPVHREVADNVRTVLGVLGVYLLIFGLVAAGWSVRAAVGARLYSRLYFGKHDAETELRLSRKAFSWNPRFYSLCIRAAKTAYIAAQAESDPEKASGFYREAGYWVSRGLDLNPRLMELHFLRARLLAVQGKPVEAAEAWKSYVNWHFWDPDNLEILARFQEEAGMTREALETLKYLKRWPKHDAWRKRLTEKLETEGATAPPVIGAPPAAGPP